MVRLTFRVMDIRRLPTRALRLGFIAALLVGLTFPAFALDPRSKITDLAHTAFTGADVFSQVFGLVQTQDGYLWLTTTEGIFRYDGVRFTRFEPLSRTRARRLLAARDGSLWSSSAQATSAACFRGGSPLSRSTNFRQPMR